jgi:acetyltransferase-like isoleucine patch superfamily enzyme
LVDRWIWRYLEPRLEDFVLRRHHVYGDKTRVTLGRSVHLANTLINVASGDVVVGDHSFFGHNVCLITGTHDVSRFDDDRQSSIPVSGRDIIIGRGVWIGSCATVLGPCRIGDHAVVGAGSLVRQDVPAFSVVAGVPARVIRQVPGRGDSAIQAS